MTRRESTPNPAGLGFALPKPSPSRRKRKAAPPTPHVLAWRCVTLCVDTAGRSGWAVRASGRLLASGEVDTRDEGEVNGIVEILRHEPRCQGLLRVLVLERAWGDRTNTLLALGAAHERWRAAWRRAGEPVSRVVRVYPATWRARVLGGGAHAMPREQVRPLELAAAQHEVGPECEVGPDEAAAILISRWATYAPEVGAVLPARVRELSFPLPPIGGRP